MEELWPTKNHLKYLKHLDIWVKLCDNFMRFHPSLDSYSINESTENVEVGNHQMPIFHD